MNSFNIITVVHGRPAVLDLDVVGVADALEHVEHRLARFELHLRGCEDHAVRGDIAGLGGVEIVPVVQDGVAVDGDGAAQTVAGDELLADGRRALPSELVQLLIGHAEGLRLVRRADLGDGEVVERLKVHASDGLVPAHPADDLPRGRAVHASVQHRQRLRAAAHGEQCRRVLKRQRLFGKIQRAARVHKGLAVGQLGLKRRRRGLYHRAFGVPAQRKRTVLQANRRRRARGEAQRVALAQRRLLLHGIGHARARQRHHAAHVAQRRRVLRSAEPAAHATHRVQPRRRDERDHGRHDEIRDPPLFLHFNNSSPFTAPR